MGCRRAKPLHAAPQPVTGNGNGLIERIKQGQGRPTKLYVKRFTTRTAQPKPAPPTPRDFLPNSDVDFSDVQRSEKSTSRSRKSRRPEVEKTDPNHTKKNHPDFSHPDPSPSPQSSPGAAMGIDRYEQREEVKANIDFENLQNAHPYDDVESLLELMVDVLCSTAPTMRIAGEVLPTETVKERFRKLDSSHIEYIIEAMSQTTTKINNIRAYLLTALYNAPVTMGPYYSAAVRHDFG